MLLDELETDPKPTAAQLRQWHERHRAHPRYALTLAEAIVSGAPALERAGTCLLRRWVGEGATLPPEALAIVIDGLDGVRSHLGRLVLNQFWAENPSLMESAPTEIGAFLCRSVADSKATVRVWSFNALWLLARRHPEFRAEAHAALRRAKRDPEACVSARLRQMGLLPYPAKKKPAAKGGGRARNGRG